MDALAAELNKRRPDFGVANGIQFREALEASDFEGRFELDTRGHVRKVERSQRQPRYMGSTASQANDAASTWAAPVGEGKTAPLATTSVSSARAAAATEAAPVASPAVVSVVVKSQAPSGPPGEHWTQYVDDGEYWWYYEGPLGKWWMQPGDSQPAPWVEE